MVCLCETVQTRHGLAGSLREAAGDQVPTAARPPGRVSGSQPQGIHRRRPKVQRHRQTVAGWTCFTFSDFTVLYWIYSRNNLANDGCYLGPRADPGWECGLVPVPARPPARSPRPPAHHVVRRLHGRNLLLFQSQEGKTIPSITLQSTVIYNCMSLFQCFVPITDGNYQALLDELEWKFRRKREADPAYDPQQAAEKVWFGRHLWKTNIFLFNCPICRSWNLGLSRRPTTSTRNVTTSLGHTYKCNQNIARLRNHALTLLRNEIYDTICYLWDNGIFRAPRFFLCILLDAQSKPPVSTERKRLFRKHLQGDLGEFRAGSG